jgi:hypothetical protein
MFTSREPIPYPPPGCKIAYIQNSRALVVPVGSVLPPICVQCGLPSDVLVKTTFHWPQPEPFPVADPFHSPWMTPLLDDIGFLFRCIFRLDTRITVGVPLCAGHHDEEKFWRWLGVVLSVFGSLLLWLSFRSLQTTHSLSRLMAEGTIALLIGGTSLIFVGVNTLDLVELNTAFAAYKGFGRDYMKKMPHEVQIFPPRYGAALTSSAQSDRRVTESTPNFSTDLL